MKVGFPDDLAHRQRVVIADGVVDGAFVREIDLRTQACHRGQRRLGVHINY